MPAGTPIEYEAELHRLRSHLRQAEWRIEELEKKNETLAELLCEAEAHREQLVIDKYELIHELRQQRTQWHSRTTTTPELDAHIASLTTHTKKED